MSEDTKVETQSSNIKIEPDPYEGSNVKWLYRGYANNIIRILISGE